LLARVWLGPRQGPRFSNVRELQAWAEGRGLHCRSDAEDGSVTGGVAVSTRPLTWEHVGRLCRAAPGKGPRWEGVIWAMNRARGVDTLPAPPWDGECRVWGGNPRDRRQSPPRPDRGRKGLGDAGRARPPSPLPGDGLGG
jgi:hypothetical protein